MADDTTRTLNKLAQDLREEIQGVEEVEGDLQDIRQHLNRIQEMYSEYKQVFAAISQVSYTNFQEASPQQQYATISKLDSRVPNHDLTDPDEAVQLEKVIKQEFQDFEAIMEDIREIDSILGTLNADDQEVEKILEKLEANFEQMEEFVEILETMNSNQ